MASNAPDRISGYEFTRFSEAQNYAFSSSGVSQLGEQQQDYADFATDIVNSVKSQKRSARRGRSIITVNTGPRLVLTLAEVLKQPNDRLFVVDYQPARIDSVANRATKLNVGADTLKLAQGDFFTLSRAELIGLASDRFDYVIFGLGSPSEFLRPRRGESGRILTEILKTATLLREGGSLVAAPHLRDRLATEVELGRNRFQIDATKSKPIGDFQALRAIAQRLF